jgi:hypothetical protein
MMHHLDDAILNILTDAGARIQPLNRWCTGRDAVDHRGMAVEALSPHAARWCAAGSMSRSKATYCRQEGDGYLLRAASLWLGSRDLTHFDLALVNDNRGHKAVMETYDIACSLRLNDLDLLQEDKWNPETSPSRCTAPTS